MRSGYTRCCHLMLMLPGEPRRCQVQVMPGDGWRDQVRPSDARDPRAPTTYRSDFETSHLFKRGRSEKKLPTLPGTECVFPSQALVRRSHGTRGIAPVAVDRISERASRRRPNEFLHLRPASPPACPPRGPHEDFSPAAASFMARLRSSFLSHGSNYAISYGEIFLPARSVRSLYCI